MKSQLIVLDTADDRREIGTLLAALPPAARLDFLRWCCLRCPQGTGRVPMPVVSLMKVTVREAEHDDGGDRRFTAEVRGDVLNLFANFKLDATETALELERWVRRPAHRAAVRDSLSRASRRPSDPSAGSRTSCT